MTIDIVWPTGGATNKKEFFMVYMGEYKGFEIDFCGSSELYYSSDLPGTGGASYEAITAQIDGIIRENAEEKRRDARTKKFNNRYGF